MLEDDVTYKALTGAVLRTARDLRDKTRLCTEPEQREAWNRLDAAINARDTFLENSLHGG